MLKAIGDRLGSTCLSRILEDSFGRERVVALLCEAGIDVGTDVPAKTMASLLLKQLADRPELDEKISQMLDDENESLLRQIEQCSPDLLLQEYSPQNADLHVPAGCLLWCLAKEEKPECEKLIRVWCDFLDERKAKPKPTPSGEITPHSFDDDRLSRIEREAMESWSREQGQAKQEPEKPQTGVSEHALESDESDREISSDRLEAINQRLDALEAQQDSFQQALGQWEARLTSLDRRIEQALERMQSMSQELDSIKTQKQPDFDLVRLESIAATTEQMQERIQAMENHLTSAIDDLSTRIDSLSEKQMAMPAHTRMQKGDIGHDLAKLREEILREQTDLMAMQNQAQAEIEEQAPVSVSAGEEIHTGSEKEAVEESISLPAEQIPSRVPPPARFDPSMLPAEPILSQETVIIIGGLESFVGDYRAMVEGLGGCFERYDSVDEFSAHWLENLVDKAHLLIVLGNVATRPGTYQLMEIAERLGRRFYVHHSTAPASLFRLFMQLVEKGRL